MIRPAGGVSGTPRKRSRHRAGTDKFPAGFGRGGPVSMFCISPLRMPSFLEQLPTSASGTIPSPGVY